MIWFRLTLRAWFIVVKYFLLAVVVMRGGLEAYIKELAELSFIPRAENILFLGPPGTGKTHPALGSKACQSRYKVLFFSTTNLHHSHIISINGPSYRIKDKLKKVVKEQKPC